MDFIQKNLNPSGKKKNDCVVRAIMYAERQTWFKVFDWLTEIARLERDMPNSKKVYEKVLERLGWKKQPMPRFHDNTRFTVKEFADRNNKGIVILSVAKHLTIVDGKNLIDTWDCSYKSVGNYWIK